MKYKLLIFVMCVCILMTSCGNGPTDTNSNPPAHECTSLCETCGKCINSDCNEEKCKQKCDGGHINLPDIDIDDLK